MQLVSPTPKNESDAGAQTNDYQKSFAELQQENEALKRQITQLTQISFTVSRLARGLSEGEIRLLLDLVPRALAPGVEDFEFLVSSRELAQSARCSRKWSKLWLENLTDAKIISTRITKSGTWIRMNIFTGSKGPFGSPAPEAISTFSNGVATPPDNFQKTLFGGVATTPRTPDSEVPAERKSGVVATPRTPDSEVPADENFTENKELYDEKSRASAGAARASESDLIDLIKHLIDQINTGEPKSCDSNDFEQIRRDIRGYHASYFERKFRDHAPETFPVLPLPDDGMLAGFLKLWSCESICGVIQALRAAGTPPGHEAIWWRSVFLERLKNIKPEKIKEALAAIRQDKQQQKQQVKPGPAQAKANRQLVKPCQGKNTF